MGNCIGGQAAVSWTDEEEEEEWEWAEANHRRAKTEEAREQLLGEKGKGLLHPEAAAAAAAAATEVKIKISKKQLEELLRKVDAQGLPLQQVLARLMSGACDLDALHDRAGHWRPALQSIPEAAESQL